MRTLALGTSRVSRWETFGELQELFHISVLIEPGWGLWGCVDMRFKKNMETSPENQTGPLQSDNWHCDVCKNIHMQDLLQGSHAQTCCHNTHMPCKWSRSVQVRTWTVCSRQIILWQIRRPGAVCCRKEALLSVQDQVWHRDVHGCWWGPIKYTTMFL